MDKLDAENSDTWAPINLSGGSVKLRIREVGQTTVLSTITATLSDPSNSKCTLIFPDMDKLGTYERLEFTKSDGNIRTVQI